jgi:ATP-dependent DNA helicase RecQ
VSTEFSEAPPAPVSAADLERLARERLGLGDLRPGQLEAARAVVAGEDVLCVMATGAGKSAVYQLAGLARPGTTVVVSPLIALQHDQLESADEADSAAMVNSTLPTRVRDEILEGAAAGEIEFVLLAPEQLTDPEVVQRLREGGVSLMVVDEAHCASEWGHDFRPDYLRLGSVAEALGRPPILALTATATPQVREAIIELLGMRDPRQIITGFDRPNLRLAVRRFHDDDHKHRAVLEYVTQAQGSGIVYCATQRATVRLAGELQEAGVRAAAYHGSLPAKVRAERQDAYMAGELDVMVATIAFGMGIDKPDVRWVVHHDVSGSLDSYYQEIGRAGRDGDPAEAVLFYRPQDLGLRRYFAAGRVEGAVLDRVARALQDAPGAVPPARLAKELALSQTKLGTSLTHLERSGFAEIRPDGDVELAAVDRPALEEAVAAGEAGEARRKAFDRTRVDVMRAYAEGPTCRRAAVLSYFGELFTPPCGACDVCEAATEEDAAAMAPPDDLPFRLGDRVLHRSWGPGVVGQADAERLTVTFDTVGYRTLATDLVREGDLLTPADEMA